MQGHASVDHVAAAAAWSVLLDVVHKVENRLAGQAEVYGSRVVPGGMEFLERGVYSNC